MSIDPNLQDLIEAYFDNCLTAEQVQQLEEQLRGNHEAKRQYLAAMALHADLAFQSRATAESLAASIQHAPVSAPVDPALSSQPLSFFSLHRRHMRYALAASLILCVGVIASVMNLISVQTQDKHGKTPTTVATLTETQDAVFDVSDVPTAAGSQLSGGFLRLRLGTAKVVFFSGAEVTLEGPCEFGINSASRGFLKVGRIAAYVPAKAHGFTVGGPACAVVDLGTRFIMTVGKDGGSSVRVTEGNVELQSGTAVQPLTVWQTAQVSAGGAIHDVITEPDPSLALVADSLKGGKLPAGLEVAGSSAQVTSRGVLFTGEVGQRTYVRTIRTDWYLTSFVAEVTVDVPDTADPYAITFFGLGTGDRTETTAYGEPIFGPHVLTTLRNDQGVIDSRLNVAAPAGVVHARNLHIRGGTHKLRMFWDAETQKARFEFEEGNRGVITANFELDASNVIFSALNSRILFGGGAGLVFRDFTVKPVEAGK